VRGQGLLDERAAIGYRTAFEPGTFELAPVVGNPKIWVEMRRGDAETANVPPPTTFVGRLVPLNSTLLLLRRRMPPALSATAGSAEIWVLVDGAAPASLRWTIGLFALLVAFALYNVVAIARILRPLR
jgi:hypothetical protein